MWLLPPQTLNEKRNRLETHLSRLLIHLKTTKPESEPAIDLTYLLTGRGTRRRTNQTAPAGITASTTNTNHHSNTNNNNVTTNNVPHPWSRARLWMASICAHGLANNTPKTNHMFLQTEQLTEFDCIFSYETPPPPRSAFPFYPHKKLPR